MGWTGIYTPERKASIDEVRADILHTWTEDGVEHSYTDVRTTQGGRNVWSVIRHNGEPVAIRLDLIKRGIGGWHNKSLDESMGPSEKDCPLALLEIVPDPCTTSSTAWRKRVRAHHAAEAAKRAVIKQLAVGQVVSLKYSAPCTITKIEGTRILGLIEGRLYRIPRTQITAIYKEEASA